jgi:hypothetical protein
MVSLLQKQREQALRALEAFNAALTLVKDETLVENFFRNPKFQIEPEEDYRTAFNRICHEVIEREPDLGILREIAMTLLEMRHFLLH